MLCEILAETGLAFHDIDRYAVTTGPGSFTGIRVALATAHGLALATGAPIIGVSVFEAFAAAATRAGVATPRLLVVVESKRAECFAQLFNPRGEAIGEAAMVALEQLDAWSGPGALTIAGDAVSRTAPFLTRAMQSLATDATASVDPVTLARIAQDRPAQWPPAPFYLRAPDATPSRPG